MVNKERGSTYSWLLTCPPSDINFQRELREADIETIEAVLAEIPAEGNVTRRKVLESRLRRLRRKNG